MLRKLSESLARLAKPRPQDDGRMDFDDGPLWQQHDRYDRNTIEALALETVIAPSLGPMAGTTVYKEQLALEPRVPGQSLAQTVRDALDRRPSAVAMQGMQSQDFLILQKPVPPTPMLERANPFDDDTLSALMTPMPKRPVLRHRPISFRTKRDVPLLTQTLRRNHQEAFVRQMMQRIQDEIAEEQARDILEDTVSWTGPRGTDHWGSYSPTAPPATPPRRLDTYTGPHNEQVTIYYDQQGRPFV